MTNNLLFKLIDEKIRGYRKAIFNDQYKHPNDRNLKEWRRKIAYYESCKVIIASSIDLSDINFDDY